MAKTGEDWHLKIQPSKPHFNLQSLFDKKHNKSPPGKYLWQGHFKTLQALYFFWSPVFKIWDSPKNVGEVAPPSRRGARGLILCNGIDRYDRWRNGHSEIIFLMITFITLISPIISIRINSCHEFSRILNK